MPRFRFQTVTDRNVTRTDHIWFKKGQRWKCVLCGGLTDSPPPYPTPDEFIPDEIEDLTDQERALCPFQGAKQ